MTAEDTSLEPLVTECPHCSTRFRVTEQQLQLAAGRVRCGACLTVFQGVERLVWDEPSEFESDEEAQHALDALLDELGQPADEGEADEGGLLVDDTAPADAWPDAASAEAAPTGIELEEHHWPGARARAEADPERRAASASPEPEPVAPEPSREATQDALEPTQNALEATQDAREVARDGPAPAVAEQAAEPELAAPADAPEPAVAAAPEPVAQDAPAAVDTPTDSAALARDLSFGEARKRRWWVPVAMVTASLVLVVQVLWFQFDRWAVDLRIRPVYSTICGVLGCELPVLRDVEAMVARNLVVRSHPDVADALLVNAVIVNQAPFAQPFPNLALRFTTLNGNLVAGREFRPDEYLAGELLGAADIPRNVPVHVELAIEDPGAEAVNYYLSFR